MNTQETTLPHVTESVFLQKIDARSEGIWSFFAKIALFTPQKTADSYPEKGRFLLKATQNELTKPRPKQKRAEKNENNADFFDQILQKSHKKRLRQHTVIKGFS